MTVKKSTFQMTQQQFCGWIREPDIEKIPTFPLERMQIYRDLLFNNVCSFINLVYPVARSILPEAQWQSLLQAFFQKAKCQSPLYNDISLQFREYLADHQHPILQEYPWLEELLQFEWLELYLDTVEIEEIRLTQSTTWQLTQKVWILVYQYPVYHWTTATTFAQIEPIPSAIMVWRDDQDKVCVESLSPLFAMLIEQLSFKPYSEIELYDLIQSVIPDLSEQETHVQLNELIMLLTQLRLLNNLELP